MIEVDFWMSAKILDLSGMETPDDYLKPRTKQRLAPKK